MNNILITKEIFFLFSQILLTIFSIVFFGFIPSIWYKITHKKLNGILSYLGFKKPSKGGYAYAFKITALAYLFTIFVYITMYIIYGGMEIFPLKKEYEVCSPFILIFMIILLGIRSGIWEELFFRGFIGKRLISKFGFKVGNTLQAIVFMLPHIVTFSKVNSFENVLLCINSAVMGFAFGYITEKKASGSILPTILLHGLVNIISVPILWFLL